MLFDSLGMVYFTTRQQVRRVNWGVSLLYHSVVPFSPKSLNREKMMAPLRSSERNKVVIISDYVN